MIDIGKIMFEPKRASQASLSNYIGARVTDSEEEWLRAEMKKRELTMSDLIRLALGRLHSSRVEKRRTSAR
jgi:hypothetical protein